MRSMTSSRPTKRSFRGEMVSTRNHSTTAMDESLGGIARRQGVRVPAEIMPDQLDLFAAVLGREPGGLLVLGQALGVEQRQPPMTPEIKRRERSFRQFGEDPAQGPGSQQLREQAG